MRAFNFEIKSVDTANGVMNVEYITEGHGAIEVGVRLPMEGESEDQLIELAAPFSIWSMREYMAAPKSTPTVGRKGRVEAPAPKPEPAAPAPEPTAEIVIKKRIVL